MFIFRHHRFALLLTALLFCLVVPATGLCAGGGSDAHEAAALGASLSVFWVIPFVCMLLSIAIAPLAAPHFWHHHHGKVAVFWGLAFLIPFAAVYGVSLAFYEFLHTMFLEYVPFIVLLFALFTVAGGVRLKGSLVGTPLVNSAILLVGTVLASWMGTTGAAMLLIRPLLRANGHRKYKVHTVVFFIFLVANIGGALTPLGDPPLFLGFLQGVAFFWTLQHLLVPLLVAAALLLVLYLVLDCALYVREGRPAPPDNRTGERFGFEGLLNFPLLAAVIGCVLMSGMWNPQKGFTIYGVQLELQNLLRESGLLCIAWVSWKFTCKKSRELNGFSWAPIEEVAKLFLGIFLSMIPALAILKAGTDGSLRSVIELVGNNGQPDNRMFFWLTGALSSFLDNAPTYLVFFNTAGGMAGEAGQAAGVANFLMTDWAPTLAAISAGAVFMGANTYIGNAPNFMVRSISEDLGVKMPGFFGYMAWSGAILIPVFGVLSFLFFN